MTDGLTEASGLFPNCTVTQVSHNGQTQLHIIPPNCEGQTEYCTVIADYITTLGYQTTVNTDADTPIIQAQPLADKRTVKA